MCKILETQVFYLRCVIQCLKAVFGLKVNLLKSRMFGVGNVENLDHLAVCLGWSVGSLPTTYLWLSLGATYKNCAFWNLVVSRIGRVERELFLRVGGWCF